MIAPDRRKRGGPREGAQIRASAGPFVGFDRAVVASLLGGRLGDGWAWSSAEELIGTKIHTHREDDQRGVMSVKSALKTERSASVQQG